MINPSTPPFVVTKEYRRFAEFCEACRRYQYIGLCYGPPGVGKTLSARHYAQWDMIEQCSPYVVRNAPALPPEVGACRTVFYTAPVTITPRRLNIEIGDACEYLNIVVDAATLHEPRPLDDRGYYTGPDVAELLLIDEADRLKVGGLEQLRDIYDRQHIGLVLIGMPGLEKRLSRYPQLYSRVGFVHQFRPLSEAELRFLLEQKWAHLGLTAQQADFTDMEAIAAIIRITNGNFRLLQRLFTQIERILEINDLHTVTKEVVEAARENLVIGVL